MQIVGQTCEVCGKRIQTELDGVGCLGCGIFFHDACVLEPAPEEPAADTYRTGAPKPPRKRKKASREVRCPRCGVDARKEHRARLAAVVAQREAFEEKRRVAAADRPPGSGFIQWMMVRVGFGIFFFSAAAILQMCFQR